MIQKVKELLSKPSKIIITTHRKPDGDALGSSLGLCHYLRKNGHAVTVITPSDYPAFLHWMPGNDKVIEFNEKNKENIYELIKNANIIFCLDFNQLNRIDGLEKPIRNSKAFKVKIDHHTNPEKFEDFDFSDPKVSSTSELIYDFISVLGDKKKLDIDICQCLYTGIMTDTGSFRFSGTTSKTHRIIADFLDIGVKNSFIHEQVFDNFSDNRLKFIGYCVYEKLQVLPEFATAYMAISKQEIKKFNIDSGDTEGLVNYGLAIKGINFAVLIIDRIDMVKMSFRSKNNFSVNEFARKHFNGGGHINAAGGQCKESLQKTVDDFLKLLPEYKQSILKIN